MERFNLNKYAFIKIYFLLYPRTGAEAYCVGQVCAKLHSFLLFFNPQKTDFFFVIVLVRVE